jgi:hypothetical protein
MAKQTTTRVIDKTLQKYNDDQVMGAMIFSLEFLHRGWFGERFTGDAARYMPPLLIATYIAGAAGRPLSLTEAHDAMGASHGSTGSRYIKLGVDEKLIEKDSAGSSDGRKALLLPTDLLKKEVRVEAARVIERLRQATAYIEPATMGQNESNYYEAVRDYFPKMAKRSTASLGAAFAVMDAGAEKTD